MKFTVLTPEEVQDRFDMTPEETDSLERDASGGVFHGKPCGDVVRGPGRPSLLGASPCRITFRESARMAQAIDKRAASLGMKRSDYLRHLVDEDLKAAGLA